MFIDREDKKRLALALQSLSEQEREIVIRRYYYEQKPREIARALDLPVKQAALVFHAAVAGAEHQFYPIGSGRGGHLTVGFGSFCLQGFSGGDIGHGRLHRVVLGQGEVAVDEDEPPVALV